jgi:hypothetical protein
LQRYVEHLGERSLALWRALLQISGDIDAPDHIRAAANKALDQYQLASQQFFFGRHTDGSAENKWGTESHDVGVTVLSEDCDGEAAGER